MGFRSRIPIMSVVLFTLLVILGRVTPLKPAPRC